MYNCAVCQGHEDGGPWPPQRMAQKNVRWYSNHRPGLERLMFTCRRDGLFRFQDCLCSVSDLSDYDHGVDSQHPERVVENRPDLFHFPGLVGQQARHGAVGVDAVQVNRGMADAVVEGGQIAGQLQGPGRPHRMADETLGVVQQGAAAGGKHLSEGLRFLGVAAGGAGGVRADDVDVRRLQPARRRASWMHSACRPG